MCSSRHVRKEGAEERERTDEAQGRDETATRSDDAMDVAVDHGRRCTTDERPGETPSEPQCQGACDGDVHDDHPDKPGARTRREVEALHDGQQEGDEQRAGCHDGGLGEGAPDRGLGRGEAGRMSSGIDCMTSVEQRECQHAAAEERRLASARRPAPDNRRHSQRSDRREAVAGLHE